MKTHSENEEQTCETEEIGYYEQIYGTSLRGEMTENSPAIQNLGNVETRQGRLLVFPNVL